MMNLPFVQQVIQHEVSVIVFMMFYVHTQQSRQARGHQVFNILMTKSCPSVKMHYCRKQQANVTQLLKEIYIMEFQIYTLG